MLYGIASFIVRGPRAATVVKDCAEAARSADARGKYFAVSVTKATLGAGKQLWGELPALEARAVVVGAAVCALRVVWQLAHAGCQSFAGRCCQCRRNRNCTFASVCCFRHGRGKCDRHFVRRAASWRMLWGGGRAGGLGVGPGLVGVAVRV